MRQLSEWKGVKIVEAEVCPDHIHMLVEIPPKMSVAGYIGFLKGKSSLMIFQRHGNLKYKYGNRSFWCRGYNVDTAGKNTKKIAQYIQNQLKENQLTDQMTLKEYMDPLAGVPFPVSWTVKMKKKQKETQDILSYHTQAAGCSDKARAKASGGRQPIEECGRTGL